ncbi:hypothetical protein CNBG_0940 [Cryptococcus deuterogattii R265]|uniref:Nudix hydrolase domain-containing protein n=1 Tax=Cryptococcus deuterogattii (strain R265) TaxID=294750 RepID=A0A095C3E4_CRYD2|nr:hypothetical protein CNBG_0940 [Cryptococcus deuterogattii R265]KIR36030.1 hypothetical protein I352_00972 [Cryptococcus deuterogattii MMRL2647]KIR75463.1 hypothetical protein I310_00154 [Cryptococcus deuterogattii CA1014]
MPPRTFTPSILANISRALKPPSLPPILPPHTHTTVGPRPPTDAAVLIPLMNINSEPHILMEVRANGMRVHAGEASFPGGKADDTDRDLIHTALREAHEELALPPSSVEVLGMLDPEYSLGNRSRVWPFVGFIHSAPPPFPSGGSSLPSLPLSSLILSPAEVSAILPLPLSALSDPKRRAVHLFRLNRFRPYYKIRADDLVIRLPGNKVNISEDLEIWGLSGWLLNKLAERVGWLDAPEIEKPHED